MLRICYFGLLSYFHGEGAVNIYFLFSRNYCGTTTFYFNLLFEELLFVLCTVSILNLFILAQNKSEFAQFSLDHGGTGTEIDQIDAPGTLRVENIMGLSTERVPSSGVAGNSYIEGLNNLSLETPDKIFPAEVSAAEAMKGPVDMSRKMITARRKLLIAMKRLCADLDKCSFDSIFAYLSIGLKDTRMADDSFFADLNTINDAETL